MGDILIRGVPEEVVLRLKARAKLGGRSLQQNLLDLLVRESEDRTGEFLEWVRRRQDQFRLEGRVAQDSTDFIRQMRDAGLRG